MQESVYTVRPDKRPVLFFLFFTPTVSEKNFLESETGLKIVQTGVGEVFVLHTNIFHLFC